jgi:hypothetical protein
MKRQMVAVGCALAWCGAAASATVVVPTAFRDVVKDAALIARGHVTDVRSVVVPNAGIDSVATIAVDSLLKGPAAQFVSIRVPGGQVGRYRFVAVGAPHLVIGEQAVFFLKRDPDNAWRPIGLTLGIYRVQADPQSGRPVVDPPLVPGVTASIGQVVRGDRRRAPMPIPEFESLVRLVMASDALRAPGGRR